jgi:hypothetical protein
MGLQWVGLQALPEIHPPNPTIQILKKTGKLEKRVKRGVKEGVKRVWLTQERGYGMGIEWKGSSMGEQRPVTPQLCASRRTPSANL